MKINIFGSTGVIGTKTLKIISKNFSEIEINLLTANNNYKKFIKQINTYKPKYAYIKNIQHYRILKSKINIKTKILSEIEVLKYLDKSKSDYTILAISGYEALFYFNSIINNTKHLGLVNKECIVSAGHLFKNILNKKNVKIFPLDSEHFSLNRYFNDKNKTSYNKIYLTASGGPFLNKKWKYIKNAKNDIVTKHPKWKMGFKNSIDSATLSNKCLELIEAHYLFNIPFHKLDIVVHPQALVHSIVEFTNYTVELNYFYHDMDIPILNFFLNKKNEFLNKIDYPYKFNTNSKLEFAPPDIKIFPILKTFNKINKKNPKEIIKFNIANEFATNLFIKKKISFGKIHKIVDDSINIDLNKPVNTINNIIKYHYCFNNLLLKKYENLF